MLCLSDDKPELEFEKEKEWLKKLLQSYFPEKSSFEKQGTLKIFMIERA